MGWMAIAQKADEIGKQSAALANSAKDSADGSKLSPMQMKRSGALVTSSKPNDTESFSDKNKRKKKRGSLYV